jgi:hypothetical protein
MLHGLGRFTRDLLQYKVSSLHVLCKLEVQRRAFLTFKVGSSSCRVVHFIIKRSKPVCHRTKYQAQLPS